MGTVHRTGQLLDVPICVANNWRVGLRANWIMLHCTGWKSTANWKVYDRAGCFKLMG